MILYIAGKITGDSNYLEKFAKAEKEILKIYNCETINPANLRLPKSCTWDDSMRITLQMLDLADGIILLPDWRESPGACMECGYALKAEKKIFHHKTAPP